MIFKRKQKEKEEKWNLRTMFGPNLNFAATEAYKLLRTNLVFSFPDEIQCHVIGITSPMQSEGKSSTACNTAFALAEAGAKVLLLEADLRRPSIASKLVLAKTPGLTNLLITKGDFHEALQSCSLAPNVDVITSGEVPPNPSELLSSGRMQRLLEQLKEEYEYIIIDLPPVTVVSDAIAVSKLLDGVVLIVRGEVSDKKILAETMRQLQMVNVRILGFAYRDVDDGAKKYGYRYSKKYYKYYKYYKYSSGYAKE